MIVVVSIFYYVVWGFYGFYLCGLLSVWIRSRELIVKVLGISVVWDLLWWEYVSSGVSRACLVRVFFVGVRY